MANRPPRSLPPGPPNGDEVTAGSRQALVVDEDSGGGGAVAAARAWDWMCENMGVAFNFDHLNSSDPFWVRKMGSTWWTEVRAGTVTFLTMSFILPANAAIMAVAMGRENKDDLVIATAAVSAISSVLMGVLANFPFALAPGMGLNAYFAFTVVLQKGLS